MTHEKGREMKPIEALGKALFLGMLAHDYKKPGNEKAGAIVDGMASDEREALSRLKSRDLQRMRIEPHEAWWAK